MKYIIGVTAMIVLAASPLQANIKVKDEAAIKTVVESVGLLADTGNFELLEKLYAPEVEMDYTSLTGGEVELKSPQTIMQEWASVLPGFDLTRHELSNIEVSSNGTTARATADVTADHFVGELFWQVKGSYLYQLKKHADAWQITAHTFTLIEETGTRDVFGLAVENAASTPVGYLVRQKTRQAVLDFLTALETKDMDAFASVWAEDAVQDMPYSPEGFPKRVSGKKNILDHYAGWPENSGSADFTSELVFYPMENPEMIFTEFKSDVDIVPTGRKYLQTYGGLFHVENGKIKLFREYYDPEPFSYAFGLNESDGSGR